MSKKTPLVSIATAGGLLALAFLLNPSHERHRPEVKEAMTERSTMARVIGLGSLAGFVSDYHSLGVASYTTVGERTLSVGVLGFVYVPR